MLEKSFAVLLLFSIDEKSFSDILYFSRNALINIDAAKDQRDKFCVVFFVDCVGHF
jgi:hypothetical protein